MIASVKNCFDFQDYLFDKMQQYRACRIIRIMNKALRGQTRELSIRRELSQREYCKLFVLNNPTRFNYDVESMVVAYYAEKGWYFYVNTNWAMRLEKIR